MSRVTATVMFTDVVESTARAVRAGSRADEERRNHFELVRNALVAHQGREVKTLGDGFMAIFPSASAGINCAVALQQDVEAANRGRPDPLNVRVGLAVGDITEEAGDFFGVPVVEAARLCAEAGPKQIFATAMVRGLSGTGNSFPFRDAGRRNLKGLAEGVDVVEVVWAPRVRGGVQASFADVDSRSDDAKQVIETIWGMPHMREVWGRILALLNPQAGHTVLDAGCGTGQDVLELARLVGPEGKAIGLDASHHLIEAARQAAHEKGVDNAEFHVGDISHLDLDDDSVDGSFSVRTLQYLTDPLAAVTEMRRVTRTSGRVVISDTAWETSVWDGADADVSARVTRAWADSRPTGQIGQMLFGLCRRAGLHDVSVRAVPQIVTTIDGTYERVIASHASQAVERNTINENEAAAWVAALHAAGAEGRFLRAYMTFIVAGTA